jgi:hypothetical protein
MVLTLNPLGESRKTRLRIAADGMLAHLAPPPSVEDLAAAHDLYARLLQNYRQSAEASRILVAQGDEFDVSKFLEALRLSIPSAEGHTLLFRNMFNMVLEVDGGNLPTLSRLLAEAGMRLRNDVNFPDALVTNIYKFADHLLRAFFVPRSCSPAALCCTVQVR